MDQSFSLAYVLQLMVTKLHAVAFLFVQGLGQDRFDVFGSSGVHVHVPVCTCTCTADVSLFFFFFGVTGLLVHGHKTRSPTKL